MRDDRCAVQAGREVEGLPHALDQRHDVTDDNRLVLHGLDLGQLCTHVKDLARVIDDVCESIKNIQKDI